MRYLLWKLGLAKAVRIHRTYECNNKVRLIRYYNDGTKYIKQNGYVYKLNDDCSEATKEYYATWYCEPYNGLKLPRIFPWIALKKNTKELKK